MKKTFTFLAVLLFGFLLVACDPTPTATDPTVPTPTPTDTQVDPTPSEPTVDESFDVIIDGIDNVTLTVGDAFNVLEGVTATGTDEENYTDKITVTSVATIGEDGSLDTSIVRVVALKYTVTLVEKDFMTEKIRIITIKAPPKPTGELVVNGTFAEGLTYWETYNADGSTMAETFEDGGIKLDIVVGGNIWTPRLTQMGIPFEKGVAYEITFEAKASAPKQINLQVGDLLDHDPWFTDFKPGQTEHRELTTEWATYSFTFIHNLENHDGGVLFEFGNILGSESGDEVTIWLRNIVAEETTVGADEEPPVITVTNASILVGGKVDLEGLISVFDVRDGAIPFEELEIVIKDDKGDVIDEIDTDVEGVYEITVTAIDEAGNSATETFTVEVVGMLFHDENYVANGNFKNPLGDPAEWNMWIADWNATDASFELDNDGEEVVIDVVNSGEDVWHVQFFQEGIDLVEGKTYKLQFDVKSSVASKMHIEVADGLDSGNPIKYLGKSNINTTTEVQTFEYLFTVTSDCQLGKLNFMFGAVDAAEFTLSNVMIVEAKLDQVIQNAKFNMSGYTLFINDWDGTQATLELVGDELVYNITQYRGGSESWTLQLIQDGTTIGLDNPDFIVLAPEAEYTLTFDAVSTEESVKTKVLIASDQDGWKNYVGQENEEVFITDEKQTFTITFTTPEEVYEALRFKLEFGHGIVGFDAAEGVFKELRISNLSLKDADGNELLFNGKMNEVIGFTFDHSGAGEEIGTMVRTAEGALITTTGVGGEPYMPHLYQFIEQGLQAGTYTFKLVLNADVARTLRVNLVVPDWGWISLLPDSKYDIVIAEGDIGEDVVVYVTFEIENAVTVPVKFELDFGKVDEGDVHGEFLIKEVLIYQVFE